MLETKNEVHQLQSSNWKAGLTVNTRIIPPKTEGLAAM